MTPHFFSYDKGFQMAALSWVASHESEILSRKKEKSKKVQSRKEICFKWSKALIDLQKILLEVT